MPKVNKPEVDSEIIAEGVVETPSEIVEEVKAPKQKPSKTVEVLKSKMKIIDY